jgi:hypothetical protein
MILSPTFVSYTAGSWIYNVLCQILECNREPIARQVALWQEDQWPISNSRSAGVAISLNHFPWIKRCRCYCHRKYSALRQLHAFQSPALFPSTQMGFAKLTLSWDKEWHSDMHPDCAPWLLAIALRRLCYSPYLVASLIGIARCCKIRAPLTYAEWGMLHYS